MNNRRSYLDTMNAGRQRRASTSLEQLSSTLEELEQRIRAPYGDERGPRRMMEEPRRYDPRARDTAAPARHPASYDDRPAQRSADERRIAGELHALREELRQQMSSGLRREFAALKHDIERAMQGSGGGVRASELNAEFERLSAMIHKLAEQSGDRQVGLLRPELEQVKAALGKLAREETVKSFDRRWEELDQRWSEIASQLNTRPQASADDRALAALNARLEQIGGVVNALPNSGALRSLEDKIKILATTVDEFTRQQDRFGPEAFGAIDERLDEISRAVAVSSAAARTTFDPEPFERIEARISSLARQLAEVMEDNPTNGLIDQLAALSQRVEDIAHRVDLPQHAIDRFAIQIEDISRRLDQSPPMPDLDRAFQGLESRFATLSAMLEQRQDDALAQGQALFRELEQRLDQVTSRLGTDEADRRDDRFMEAIDARFAELAARIEGQSPAGVGGDAIRDMERRIAAMSERMDAPASGAGVDPDLIRSLEAQIAGLVSHISNASPAPDLNPRLERIEQSLADGRQDIVEAARQAAEEAVKAFSGSATDGALVAGLAEDLRSLEALTRRSDDRNAKTFEAIHDTLLKIVERLSAVENAATARIRDTQLSPAQTPSLEPAAEAMPMAAVIDEDAPCAPARKSSGRRTAAAAAAEAAADAVRSDEAAATEAAASRRSMLGGLTRALSGRKARQDKETPLELAGDPPAEAADDSAPDVEIDAPLDPVFANQPLEPGSGAPDLNAIMKRVRDERGPARSAEAETAKSDFIAAARRAAQAAAAEAEMMKRSPTSKVAAGGFSLGGLLKSRRKPLLMGVAAILVALAALQVGRSFMGGEQVAEAPSPAPAEVETVAAATKEPVAEAVETTAEVPADAVETAAVSANASEEIAATPAEVESDAPSSARSLMIEAPETVNDVTAEWLEAEPAAASAAERPQTSAAAPQQAAVAAIPAGEEPAIAAAPAEDALAAIPVEAGPIALREAAAAGDARAFYEIGNRYAQGRGVGEDMAKAAEWYTKAAELGLAPAQYRIGNMFEKGMGVERDIAKAKTWYQLAASQGNASAMHNLAVLFAMGADGTTDNESAVRWFQEAAALGVTDSQFNLGILSAKGVGMPQNLEEAYKWLALVAETGDKDAAAKRDEIAKELTPEQLENARAAAELWRAKPVKAEANTVDIPPSWRDSADTTAGIDMRQAVRNIQTILNKNGYDAGPADGIMGAKTKSAIAAFQGDNGMPATGEVDEPLVRALLERS